MAAVNYLTDHKYLSFLKSLPTDFNNNYDDEYTIGFEEAFLFNGDASRSTLSNPYSADAVLYNANNTNSASTCMFLGYNYLDGDGASEVKGNDDTKANSPALTASQCTGQAAVKVLLSPETQPRTTRRTKRRMSEKAKTTLQSSSNTSKNKIPKARGHQEHGPAKSEVSGTVTNTKTSGSKSKNPKRRDRSLERNRIAASKCRKRKRQWTDTLETKKSGFEAENKSLHVQYFGLLEEASQLKSIRITHASCHDPNIDVWIENEATKYVRKLSNTDGLDQQGRSYLDSVPNLQTSLLRHSSSSSQTKEPSQSVQSLDDEAEETDTGQSFGDSSGDEIKAKNL